MIYRFHMKPRLSWGTAGREPSGQNSWHMKLSDIELCNAALWYLNHMDYRVPIQYQAQSICSVVKQSLYGILLVQDVTVM